MNDDVFVIGDVHGHVDMLEALLRLAGLWPTHDGVEVIQLGDLGHFGPGSEERDYRSYILASGLRPAVNTVLWGNHDRAVFDRMHAFSGFEPPPEHTRRLIEAARPQYATARYGFILTHAGIGQGWRDWLGVHTPLELATILNRDEQAAIISDISWARGGAYERGGILWRDDRAEPLWDDVKQIYGHTRSDSVVKSGHSYNLDICPRGGGQLAGLWLPSETIVEVR